MVGQKAGIVHAGLGHESRVIGRENVEKIATARRLFDEDVEAELFEEALQIVIDARTVNSGQLKSPHRRSLSVVLITICARIRPKTV